MVVLRVSNLRLFCISFIFSIILRGAVPLPCFHGKHVPPLECDRLISVGLVLSFPLALSAFFFLNPLDSSLSPAFFMKRDSSFISVSAKK